MTQKQLIEWGMNPLYITPEFLETIKCTATLPVRFAKQVFKADGCWLWPWGQGGSKYATIGRGKAGNGCLGAHVASYILHFGPVPKGKHVCHKCDNPRCVRPDHLFAGTQSQNMWDCSKKGRNKGKDYSNRRGENHSESKLTEIQVFRIIALINAGAKDSELVTIFKVTQSCISSIRHSRSWKHIPR
jgi:HNH endonuclease